MKPRSAVIRGTARLCLLWLCFGPLIFSAATGKTAAPAPTPTNGQGAGATILTLPLKVCVNDEAGARVAVQPLLLNSSSNAADVINKKTADGCYASSPVKLKAGQVYFVAAISEGRTAFSPLTVSSGDKEKSVNLTLAKQGGQSSAGIEICANDDGGNPLPIAGITLSDGKAQLTKQEPADSNCYRVLADASNEYNLSLTTQSVKPSAAISNTTLGILAALLLLPALATLGLTVFLTIRHRTLAPLTAQQATVREIVQAVKSLSEDTPAIRKNVEVLVLRTPPAQTQQNTNEQPGETGASDTHVFATDPPPPDLAEQTTTSPERTEPPPNTPQENRNVEDAKLKYKEFSAGQKVEHFYLMPSGSSTASGMVEGARVELLEQNKGTYVGFRSTVNEGEAMIFPMPKVHFNSETFKALFPNLKQTEYESGMIEPRRAVNTQPKVWKVQ
jgi:cytoskeletal protein RodZ